MTLQNTGWTLIVIVTCNCNCNVIVITLPSKLVSQNIQMRKLLLSDPADIPNRR